MERIDQVKVASIVRCKAGWSQQWPHSTVKSWRTKSWCLTLIAKSVSYLNRDRHLMLSSGEQVISCTQLLDGYEDDSWQIHQRETFSKKRKVLLKYGNISRRWCLDLNLNSWSHSWKRMNMPDLRGESEVVNLCYIRLLFTLNFSTHKLHLFDIVLYLDKEELQIWSQEFNQNKGVPLFYSHK